MRSSHPCNPPLDTGGSHQIIGSVVQTYVYDFDALSFQAVYATQFKAVTIMCPETTEYGPKNTF